MRGCEKNRRPCGAERRQSAAGEHCHTRADRREAKIASAASPGTAADTERRKKKGAREGDARWVLRVVVHGYPLPAQHVVRVRSGEALEQLVVADVHLRADMRRKGDRSEEGKEAAPWLQQGQRRHTTIYCAVVGGAPAAPRPGPAGSSPPCGRCPCPRPCPGPSRGRWTGRCPTWPSCGR